MTYHLHIRRIHGTHPSACSLHILWPFGKIMLQSCSLKHQFPGAGPLKSFFRTTMCFQFRHNIPNRIKNSQCTHDTHIFPLCLGSPWKISFQVPLEEESLERYGLIIHFFHKFPVSQLLEEGFHIVLSSVLIVKVIGVLPHITCEKGSFSV